MVGGRIARAFSVATNEIARAEGVRTALVQAIEGLLGNDDAWFLWPSAAGAAPRRGLSDAEIDGTTGRALVLGALASLAGLPQVTLPIAEVDGCPFGLSLIGPRGSDRALLAAAELVAKRTNLPASPLKESPS